MNLNITKKAEKLILDEYYLATGIYDKFNSAHEGFAILLEEIDELWESVKLKQSYPYRKERMFKEAIQVGAMTLRFLIDCCGSELNE